MRTRTIFSAAVLAGTLTGALRAQESGAGASSHFICDGNYFSASVPADWEQAEEIVIGREEKQYGVDLTAPGTNGGALTTISLLYFGPDHLRFRTYEDYILTVRTPIKPMPGEEQTPPSSVTLNGRPAITYEILRYNSIPPYAARPVQVLMYDKYVVVPAERGFYVLRLHAPREAAQGYLGVFERILASFRPTVK